MAEGVWGWRALLEPDSLHFAVQEGYATMNTVPHAQQYAVRTPLWLEQHDDTAYGDEAAEHEHELLQPIQLRVLLKVHQATQAVTTG